MEKCNCKQKDVFHMKATDIYGNEVEFYVTTKDNSYPVEDSDEIISIALREFGDQGYETEKDEIDGIIPVSSIGLLEKMRKHAEEVS